MIFDASILIRIFSFFTPKDHTLDSVRKTKTCLITMAPTNKLIFSILYPRIARLHKAEQIIAKYVIDASDPLYLINMLRIGMGGPINYITNFDSIVEKDVKWLIEFAPRLLTIRSGSVGLRSQMTPFSVACLNPGVPPSLVEHFLKLGADPNETYLLLVINMVGNSLWDAETRIQVNVMPEKNRSRIVKVIELLKKYGGLSIYEQFGPIETAEVISDN